MFGPDGVIGSVVLFFSGENQTLPLTEEGGRILELTTSVMALTQTRESYRERVNALKARIQEQERDLLVVEGADARCSGGVVRDQRAAVFVAQVDA